eukprot:4496382-Amphidinium_carterae.1
MHNDCQSCTPKFVNSRTASFSSTVSDPSLLGAASNKRRQVASIAKGVLNERPSGSSYARLSLHAVAQMATHLN